MIWLYILTQLIFYAALAFVLYRFVYKTMQENRKAALTERPEDDDYVPETVDAAFIQRLSGGRDRGLRTKREYDLAAILENWNPAEFDPVTPGAYDASVTPVIDIFEAKPTNKDRGSELRQHFRLTYQVDPKNVEGMHHYLRNWITLNPVS